MMTAAAATVVALSAQTAAQAAPTISTKDAKSQVDADRSDAAAKTEQWNQANTQKQAVQQRVAILQDEIARQQAQVNGELDNLGQIANSQYANGAVDPTLQLMLSSSPDAFLQKAASQDEFTSNQTAELQALVAQESTLQREKAEAAAELAQEQQLLAQMSQAKTSALAKLKQAQSVLDALTPAQQVAVNGGGGGYGSVSTSGWSGTIDLSGISSAARTAMEAAMGQIGRAPYLWGGDTPQGFDCSGLVMWAYAHAGISLPHSSQADESVGTAVPSIADAQVGDIIVLEGGEHVGLYAGNGMLLNAPEYGYDVSVQPISWFHGIVAIRRM